MPDTHAQTTLPSGPDRDEDVVERRTLRDYYIILRERLWIALPLAVLIGVAYGYKKMQVTPTYYARATMQFEKPETLVTAQGVIDAAVRSDVDLNTYLEQLRSQKIRARVLESLKPEEKNILRRAALKRLPQGVDPNSVEPSLGSMTAVSTRASYIISINVTHEDPEAAALVANRYVAAFMDHLFSTVGGRNESAIVWLQDQAERLKKESEAHEQDLQRYMREKNLISLDSSKDIVTEALKKAGTLKEEKRLNLLALDEKVKQIDAFQKEGKSLFEINEIASHGSVPVLKAQLNKLEQELALLAERYFEKHPRMWKNRTRSR